MEYYQSHISKLAREQAESYRQGVQKLRRAIVSSSSLLPSVQTFWVDKMQRPLMVVYGATELGGAAFVRAPAPFPDEAVSCSSFSCVIVGHTNDLLW
jgi:acyl-coenzyme A synthetase/AMP-(fatty) acid ligase